ncbi:hypothetical protein GEMRC1_006801 [Eukaryota sp. GEM-RC1]
MLFKDILEADLVAGRGDWKNIQDVVRDTFAAFYSAISQQQMTITRLESELANRPTYSEVSDLLASKVSYLDFKKALDSKPSVDDVNTLLEEHASAIDSVRDKAALQHSELLHSLSDKASIDQVNEALSQKANKVSVANALHKKVSKSDFETRLVDVSSSFCTQKDFRQFTGDVYSKLQDLSDADLVTHKELLKSLGDVETRVADSAERRYLPRYDNTARALTKKADVSLFEQKQRETEVLLSSKANTSDVNNALKAARSEIESLCDIIDRLKTDCITLSEKKVDSAVIDSLSSSVDALQSQLSLKIAESEQLSRDLNSLESRLSVVQESVKDENAVIRDLQSEINQKAATDEICALLDLKANIDDVNSALHKFSKDLNSKAPLTEFSELKTKTSTISESLVHELCLGRWVWKSGKTKSGHGIPWNVQLINTDPDVFRWEKDKVTICAALPGLYEITFGFFANKKPTVQLLVNGEPVLSAINSSSYVLHHSSGRLASAGQHSVGNVTGLTCIDFLVLPARARLAISYQGEEGAEGFLGLRKL